MAIGAIGRRHGELEGPRVLLRALRDADFEDWNREQGYPVEQTNNLALWLGVGGNYNTTTNTAPDPSRGPIRPAGPAGRSA